MCKQHISFEELINQRDSSYDADKIKWGDGPESPSKIAIFRVIFVRARQGEKEERGGIEDKNNQHTPTSRTNISLNFTLTDLLSIPKCSPRTKD